MKVRRGKRVFENNKGKEEEERKVMEGKSGKG